MSVKDMYADLEKIEARGKRKKEKSKGLFSSFGKKEEQDAAPTPEPETAPQPEQAVEEPVPLPPQPVPTAAPEPAQKPPRPQPAKKPVIDPSLKKAQEELMAYKKWLNSGFKAGVLTKQQCLEMSRKKEIELGLRSE